MELNANFAMFNAKERTNSKCNRSIIYARTSALYRKDIGYCNPLLDASATHACVCSLARTGGNSLSCLFNSNSKMPKDNGIKASVKYSSTTFTLSHETAKNQFSINPTLLQMLYHASKLFLLAETHFKHLKSLKVSHDVEQHIIGETADTAGEIINQIGSVIGIDMAEQGFNLK